MKQSIFVIIVACWIAGGASTVHADRYVPSSACYTAGGCNYEMAWHYRMYATSYPQVAVWQPDPDDACRWVVPYEVFNVDSNTDTVYPATAFGYWAGATSAPISFTGSMSNYYDWSGPSSAKLIAINIYNSQTWNEEPDVYGMTTQQIYETTGVNYAYRIYYATVDVMAQSSAYPAGATFTAQDVLRHEVGHALLFAPEAQISSCADGMYLPSGQTSAMGAVEAAAYSCVYSSDYVFACGWNVLARATGFWVDSNLQASWEVVLESEVEEYSIEALVGSDWVELLAGEPSGLGQHIVQLPSPSYEKYRLVERSTGGAEVLAYTSSGDRVPPVASGQAVNLDGLLAGAVNTYRNSARASAEVGLRAGDGCLVVGPEAFVDTFAAYINPLWVDVWQASVQYVNTDTIGGGSEELRDAIKTEIASAASNGIYNVVLLGGANDYLEFQSDAWQDEPWASMRNDYIASGYPVGGSPVRDIVPTCYYFDTRHPKLTMAQVTPYTYSDLGYADIDGDGLPEVNVARWPVWSTGEVKAVLAKLYSYSMKPIQDYRALTRSIWYGGDGDYRPGLADGDRLRQQVAQYIEGVPVKQLNWTLNMSDIVDWSTLTEEFVEEWNDVEPDIVFVYSNGSNEYSVGGFIDRESWSPALLEAGVEPVVVAASCMTSDFARTYSVNLGCQTALGIFGDAERGAAFWIGPTSATWQEGNTVFVDKFSKAVAAGDSVGLGEIFTTAQLEILQENTTDGFVAEVARIYTFWGDPLSPFRAGVEGLSSVPLESEGLRLRIVATPNPFNPNIEVRFVVTPGSRVTVKVYDLAGRLQRVLFEGIILDEAARCNWDGRDTNGASCASGTYFVRVDGSGLAASKKIMLIR